MRVWVGWIIDPPQDPPFAGPTLMSRVNAGCCSFVCRAVQEQLPNRLVNSASRLEWLDKRADLLQLGGAF